MDQKMNSNSNISMFNNQNDGKHTLTVQKPQFNTWNKDFKHGLSFPYLYKPRSKLWEEKRKEEGFGSKMQAFYHSHNNSTPFIAPKPQKPIETTSKPWKWTHLWTSYSSHGGCHTLISSGDYRLLIFWSLLVNLWYWTPIIVRNRWSFNVLTKNAKDTEKEGKRVILSFFQNLGSPRLASSSPGPPKDLRVK